VNKPSAQDVLDAGLDDWRKLAQALHARYRIADFTAGAAFVAAVAEAAEAAGHHPDLKIIRGVVTGSADNMIYGSVLDPATRGPNVWFQGTDEHQTPRQRWHFDLWLAPRRPRIGSRPPSPQAARSSMIRRHPHSPCWQTRMATGSASARASSETDASGYIGSPSAGVRQ
jgi:hypothetical protein